MFQDVAVKNEISDFAEGNRDHGRGWFARTVRSVSAFQSAVAIAARLRNWNVVVKDDGASPVLRLGCPRHGPHRDYLKPGLMDVEVMIFTRQIHEFPRFCHWPDSTS